LFFEPVIFAVQVAKAVTAFDPQGPLAQNASLFIDRFGALGEQAQGRGLQGPIPLFATDVFLKKRHFVGRIPKQAFGLNSEPGFTLKDHLARGSCNLVLVQKDHFTATQEPIAVAQNNAPAQCFGAALGTLIHPAFPGFDDFKRAPTVHSSPRILGLGDRETQDQEQAPEAGRKGEKAHGGWMAAMGRRFGQKYPQGSKFEGFDESAFFGELVSDERTQRERDLCDSASGGLGAGLPTFRPFRHG
jgi:hypothetical protein